MNALNLLCGSRLNNEIVGTKADETLIEGVFEFKPGSHGYLRALDYDFEPEEACVFSRTITKEGRSIYKVNRQNVNLSLVKDMLRDEVDIHSQFDTNYLRDDKFHLGLLDQVHQQTELIKQVKESYHSVQALEKEKKTFLKTILSESEREFLRLQVDEIEKLKLNEQEFLEINDTLSQMENHEQNHAHLQSAYQNISDLDIQIVWQSLSSLKSLVSPSDQVKELIEMLESSYYQIDEAQLLLRKVLDKDVFDPYEFERLQARQFEYNKIKRKYRMSIEELFAFVDQSKQKLSDSENEQYLIDEFDQKISKMELLFNEKANQLSLYRQNASKELKVKIEEQLHDLMLSHAVFDVEFYDNKSEDGLEDCRFMIAINKGQSLQPLSKVASGGELSRFMLGMKVIFNALANIELVIFDEIDTGISGPVALQVGLKMYELAQTCNVITITHLPAVAACGDTHYLVAKTSDDVKTLVNINKLNTQQRIEELAQMAFTNTNEASLKAAKELLLSTDKRKDLKL